jgi:hypothetical protein
MCPAPGDLPNPRGICNPILCLGNDSSLRLRRTMVLTVHGLMRGLVLAGAPRPAHGKALLNTCALFGGGGGLCSLPCYTFFITLLARVKDLSGCDGGGHSGGGSSRDYPTVCCDCGGSCRERGLLVGTVDLLVRDHV